MLGWIVLLFASDPLPLDAGTVVMMTFIGASFLVPAALLAAGALRLRICACDEGLQIWNLVTSRLVPWDEIEDVEAGYYGLVIQRTGGEPVLALACQKSNLASWLGRTTRADRIAQQIRVIAQTRRSDGGVPHP